jgi:type I restriction enzyme S subunit
MRFPIYPEYKNIEVKWLGQIPSSWDVKRFKQVFVERDERSIDGSQTLLSVSAYTGVSPRSEIRDQDEHISRSESLEGYKVCYPNDLVINIMLAWNRGLGVSSYNGIVSPAYCVFEIIDDSEPDFLDYLVRTDEYTNYFKAFSTGVIDSRLRIYPDTFGALYVGLPKKDEQKIIAKFLNHETAKIDKLIIEQEKLIELLKEKRQAVISHAVTKGLNPKVRMKDSGVEWLGEVPDHWEVTKIKYIASASNGLTYSPDDLVDSDEGVLVLRSSNIQQGQISLEDNVYVKMNIPSKSVVKGGDILICSRNGSRALIGKNVLIPDSLNGVAYGAFMMLLRSDISRYIYWILNSFIFKFQSSLFLTSTINQLTVSDLYAFEVPIPSKSEQDEIIKYLQNTNEKLNALIENATKSVALLQERRSALISAAVTGQIDVRNYQAKEIQ